LEPTDNHSPRAVWPLVNDHSLTHRPGRRRLRSTAATVRKAGAGFFSPRPPVPGDGGEDLPPVASIASGRVEHPPSRTVRAGDDDDVLDPGPLLATDTVRVAQHQGVVLESTASNLSQTMEIRPGEP